MRRPPVEPRRVIFICVEGESDRAFVRFLGKCCEREGRHLHLDVNPANGGDSVAVVKAAVRYLSIRSKKDFHRRLVLLDSDRIEQDKGAGRDAQALASKHGLEIVLQSPNLEGLLLRLYPKHERRNIQADDAMQELQKVWPEYRKSPTVDQIDQRFKLPDLRRAAKHDQHLRRLLEILELAETNE